VINIEGLIIGSFQPLHLGHLYLIRKSKDLCDHLTILVCCLPNDVIDGNLRFDWMCKSVKNISDNITVDICYEDLPDSEESSEYVSEIWSKYLKERYPNVELIFSSEKYGEYIAKFMNIFYYKFDRTNISGTKIRNNPFTHWDQIPDVVKPYYTKKICIYGAESTGKSTLTKKLAEKFKTSYVPEIARNLLGNRKCEYKDIEIIAKLQTEAIEREIKNAYQYLFCDTDLNTTEIYSMEYFHKTPQILTELLIKEKYDLYLLLNIDTEWVKDSQRDLGSIKDRKRMHNIFESRLKEKNIPYVLIEGNWNERLNKAIEYITNLR
jgi:HTH-type transcriptional repressor of NAD biosynthesis genes